MIELLSSASIVGLTRRAMASRSGSGEAWARGATSVMSRLDPAPEQPAPERITGLAGLLLLLDPATGPGPSRPSGSPRRPTRARSIWRRAGSILPATRPSGPARWRSREAIRNWWPTPAPSAPPSPARAARPTPGWASTPPRPAGRRSTAGAGITSKPSNGWPPLSWASWVGCARSSRSAPGTRRLHAGRNRSAETASSRRGRPLPGGERASRGELSEAGWSLGGSGLRSPPVEWWRRWASNPRPETLGVRLLHP